MSVRTVVLVTAIATILCAVFLPLWGPVVVLWARRRAASTSLP